MIKAYESQTVHSAMIDAIVAQEIERQNSVRVAELEAENARLRAELELRRQKDGRIYSKLIESAERDYPVPARASFVGAVWWSVLGWVILAFGALFDALGV